MNYSNLEERLINDLSWTGAYTSTSGLKRLKSAILSAALKVWNKRPLPWMISSTTLNTTSGTLGPYDPPSDFKGFPLPREASNFLWDDVPLSYVIRETETEEWRIFYDENQQKFYFQSDPGDNSLTVYYVGSFDNVLTNISTTMSVFPEELFEVIKKFVISDRLDNSNSKKESQAYEAEGYALLEIYYENFFATRSRSNQRRTKGFNGANYDGIAEAYPLNRQLSRIQHNIYG
jgi:hypothetical protein